MISFNDNILAQKITDFRAMGIREQVGARIGRPDCVRLIEESLSSGVEVRRRPAKRECEHKRLQAQHASDQSAHHYLLFLFRLAPPFADPEPSLKREQGNHHCGHEQHPGRKNIKQTVHLHKHSSR
jgi:hypothetical protein